MSWSRNYEWAGSLEAVGPPPSGFAAFAPFVALELGGGAVGVVLLGGTVVEGGAAIVPTRTWFGTMS
jgi:hypothetical protein